MTQLRPVKVLLFIAALVYSVSVFAQADTARRHGFFWNSGKPSTRNDTWYLGAEPDKHYVIDSSIFNLEEYNVIQREGPDYTNAGNFGSAAFPLVYEVNRRLNFNVGYNQFDLYRYSKDSAKYYQVIRPYTELSMIIGLKNEQMFQGKFANQHKGLISYGVDFRRIFSKGAYTNQRTNDNGFNLYGIFNSRNKHWSVQADLIFNSFKVQENGGVTINVFDSAFFTKTLVPVNLTEAENNYRQIDFYLTTAYHLGKKYLERKDTALVPALMPLFSFGHQFNVEKNWRKYRDLNPLEDYYNQFLYTQDSLANDVNDLRIGNSLFTEYHMRKLDSDTSYKEQNLIIKAEAGFDYIWLEQNKLKYNTYNFYIDGVVRNNLASGSHILYRAAVKYFPFGYNQNDLMIDGYAGYDLGMFGIITGNATFQLKEAPYIFQRYRSHPLDWDYNLPKMRTLVIGGKYLLPIAGITADFNYYQVDNMPVYPGVVNTNTQNFFVLHAGNRNSFFGLHIDNDVWYTQTASNGFVKQSYPMLYTRHSIYYERRVFKKAMWLSFGFDLRFRYKNTAPYYDPLLGTFYPVNYGTNKTYPVLDFFVNVKIKTVRVFVKLDNISAFFGPKGYYASYLYPAPDFSFRVGIKWRFFE